MNRTVAFLDVLGFKDKIENYSASELGKKYSSALYFALEKYSVPGDFSNEASFFPNMEQTDKFCINYVFSDSIILTSFDDTEDSCLKLLVFTYRLMRSMIVQGFTIRGGISFGEMFVDINNSIFVGTALVKAYELESQQNWVGTLIDDNIIEKFPTIFNGKHSHSKYLDYLFVKYNVPLKKGKISEKRVINWRYNLIIEQGTKSLFKRTNEWSAKNKIDNTLLFSKYIRMNNLAYSKDDKNCPIEIRSFYVGGKEPPFNHGDEF